MYRVVFDGLVCIVQPMLLAVALEGFGNGIYLILTLAVRFRSRRFKNSQAVQRT